MNAASIRLAMTGSIAGGATLMYALALFYFVPMSIVSVARYAPLACFVAMFSGFVFVKRPTDIARLVVIGVVVSAALMLLLILAGLSLPGTSVSIMMAAAYAVLAVILFGGVVTARLVSTIGARPRQD